MTLDHELKQRLVGAAVITAIAAIFVPMLFDDPIVERGQAVNELTIPEPPQVLKPESELTTSAGRENASSVVAETAENPALPVAGSVDQVDAPPMSQELTQEEIEAEAAADKLAAERLVKELAETEDKRKVEPVFQEDAGEDRAVAPKKVKEKRGELSEKKAVADLMPPKGSLEVTSKKKAVKVLREPLAIDKKAQEQAISEKKAGKKKVQELAVAEQKMQETAMFERKTALKTQESALVEQAAALKKAQEATLVEKNNAEKLAKALVATEKNVREKAAADKIAAAKIAQQQAEEYRKLAERKAKEKAFMEKKAAEKAAAEAKIAAKQQALDDKAAIAKIAADKQATEKAAVDQKTADTPAPSRWYIRMGSFGQEANAIALRDKLRKQGFPAVVDLVKTADKGNLYRLRVGPDLNKERAEKNRLQLDAENNSSSFLELD